jgi:hypothetical protein
MALLAVHHDQRVDDAAPADLDLVADCLAARGLANQAGVERLTVRLQPGQQLGRTIEGEALLIAGDPEG